MSRTPTPLYREISSLVNAVDNCIKRGTPEWEIKHSETIEKLIKQFLPSGAGIDNGVRLDGTSKPEKLVFTFGYHHMNENGMYDGWTDHKCVVRPSLQFGIVIDITGKDRNGVKEYLYQTFEYCLTRLIVADENGNYGFVRERD